MKIIVHLSQTHVIVRRFMIIQVFVGLIKHTYCYSLSVPYRMAIIIKQLLASSYTTEICKQIINTYVRTCRCA